MPYEKYDVVIYRGSNYVALTGSTGVTPGSDAAKWRLFVDNSAAQEASDLLSSITHRTDNLFDNNKVETGYIISSTGTIYNEANSCTSDYMPVTASETYVSNPLTVRDKMYYSFWTSNKTFISPRLDASLNATGTVPATAAYVRVSIFRGTFPEDYMFMMGSALPSVYTPPYLIDSAAMVDILDNTLSSRGEAADAKAAGDAIGAVDSRIDGLSNTIFDYNTVTGFIAHNLATDIALGIDKRTGRTASVGTRSSTTTPYQMLMDANVNYDSYCFMTTASTTICGAAGSIAYYAISYLEGATPADWISAQSGQLIKYGTNGGRKRNTDGNLPTQANPLVLPAGTQVVVTVTAGAQPIIYVYETADVPTFKMSNLGGNNPVMDVEMHSTNAGEYFYYYIETASGKYLRCKFNHHVKPLSGTDPGRNADGWVQRTVDLMSAEKTEVLFPVVRDGEWEMAIQIQGAPDFIGCQNHGSEVSTTVNMYFDGVKKSITDGAKFKCSEIKVNEISNMYDPRDEQDENAT